MEREKILSELKRIRAASNCRPVLATENDISRLIAKLEAEDEWNSLMRGETLVSVDAKLSYRLVK